MATDLVPGERIRRAVTLTRKAGDTSSVLGSTVTVTARREAECGETTTAVELDLDGDVAIDNDAGTVAFAYEWTVPDEAGVWWHYTAVTGGMEHAMKERLLVTTTGVT